MESIPVVVTQISDIAPLLSKELLDLQATSACRFTVKRIYDIMRKNLFPIHTVLLNHFIYSRVKTSKILHGPSKNWLKRFLLIWSENSFCFTSYLLPTHMKNHTNLIYNNPHGYWRNTLAYNFVTDWTSIGYHKTSDFFFWLIFLVSSSPSFTTWDSYIRHLRTQI